MKIYPKFHSFASVYENSVKLTLRIAKCVFVIVQNDNGFYTILHKR